MRKLLLALFSVLVVLVAGLIIFRLNNKGIAPQTKETVVISPTPEAISAIPEVVASELTSVVSPDGEETLVMKKTKNENSVNYVFTVGQKSIFQKGVEPVTSFLLPANAWSPDNKFVFLKQIEATGSSFFVLSVGKDYLSQNEKTSNISDIFNSKYPDLSIDDVTGWGGVNLIIVNSNKSEGVRGPSFWFDAISHSLIKLSTLF